MKNLKNTISLVVGCILLSVLASVDATAQTKSKRLQKPSAKMINCKNGDDDCFIRAAGICQKARLRTTYSGDPGFGFISTGTYYSEIRGREKGKCTFYTKLEKLDIKYGEAIVRSLKKEGKTIEQSPIK